MAPLRGGAFGLTDLDAVQVAQQAHACLHTPGEGDGVMRMPLQRSHDTRHRLLRRGAGNVLERRDLEIDHRGRLGRVADLEDVTAPIRRLHQAVLVTLARQWPGAALDAVEAVDQRLHCRGGKVGRGGAQLGHKPSRPGSWRTSVNG